MTQQNDLPEKEQGKWDWGWAGDHVEAYNPAGELVHMDAAFEALNNAAKKLTLAKEALKEIRDDHDFPDMESRINAAVAIASRVLRELESD